MTCLTLLLFQSVYDPYDPYGTHEVPSGPPKVNGNSLYSSTTRYHRSQSQDPSYRSIYANGGSNGYTSMPATTATPTVTTSSRGPPLPPTLMQKASPNYKPVPPPKPKTYPHHSRNQNHGGQHHQQHLQSTSFVESNYMNANGNGTGNNGNGQVNGGGDDDSGQGSSLDRDYGLYNNTTSLTSEPRYANPPEARQQYYSYQNGGRDSSSSASPPRRTSASDHQKSLDLTNNREYRGSAFEVYKKPPQQLHHQQQYHHQSSPNHNSVW